jgi:hypothetical protein
MCAGVCKGCGNIPDCKVKGSFCQRLLAIASHLTGSAVLENFLGKLESDALKAAAHWVQLCGRDFQLMDELGLQFLDEFQVIRECSTEHLPTREVKIEEFDRISSKRILHNLVEHLEKKGFQVEEMALSCF